MATDVYTPDYAGPERRKVLEVVVKKCFCHAKHERILEDHETDIRDMKVINSDSVKALSSKVPNRLFYLFVGIVIVGLAFVYDGIHKVDKSLAVMGEKIDNSSTQYNRLEQEIKDVQDKVQERIHQTSNKIKKRREE